MEKEFVSYEQAVALKELGFNERCLANYLFNKDLEISFFRHGLDTPAPLKQQVFKFFRDKYDLYSTITDAEIYASNQSGYRWRWMIFKPIVDVCISIDKSLLGNLTYEESENDCINKLIELSKQY